MYWETPKWFSSLPPAGKRRWWLTFSASSERHWDPYSCESEEDEASGELCVSCQAAQLAPRTAAGKSFLYPDLNMTPWMSLNAWHGLKGLCVGRQNPLPGYYQARDLPRIFWLHFPWVHDLINTLHMCISWSLPSVPAPGQFQHFLKGNIDNVFVSIKNCFLSEILLLSFQNPGLKKKVQNSLNLHNAWNKTSLLSGFVRRKNFCVHCPKPAAMFCFFSCKSLSTAVRNCSLLNELRVKWRRGKVKMRNVLKKRHKLCFGQFGLALIILLFAAGLVTKCVGCISVCGRGAVLSLPSSHVSPWCSVTVWLSMLALCSQCVRACVGAVCVHVVRWCLQMSGGKMDESYYGHSSDPPESCCAAALPPWLGSSRAVLIALCL